jgi:hypothetical protein
MMLCSFLYPRVLFSKPQYGFRWCLISEVTLKFDWRNLIVFVSVSCNQYLTWSSKRILSFFTKATCRKWYCTCRRITLHLCVCERKKIIKKQVRSKKLRRYMRKTSELRWRQIILRLSWVETTETLVWRTVRLFELISFRPIAIKRNTVVDAELSLCSTKYRVMKTYSCA